MNSDLILGVLLLVFGVYSIFARFFAPHHLGKMEPMKKMWGERRGAVVHVVAYTLLPLVAGAVMIFSAVST